MIHMHRWDTVALEWLIEPRLAESVTNLLEGIGVAVDPRTTE
jgi:hypothetical protein